MQQITSKEPRKRGREKFKKYKRILNLLAWFYRHLPKRFAFYLLAVHRNTGGACGLAIRYALIKSLAKECGDNVAVFQGVFLFNVQNLKLGNNVSIHPMCYIECGADPEEGIEIGDDVSIAHGTTIIAENHSYTEKNKCIKDQPVISKKIEIQDNVWIAARCVILCGVCIGTECVIGAGSVVSRSIEAHSVAVGVPARVIKKI